jgi:hypothetical protein
MERRICHNDGVSPVWDGRIFFKECMSLSEKCYSFPIARNVERPTREGMPIIGISLLDGQLNDFAHRGHREQHLNRTQVHHISDHMVATKAITSVDEAPSMIVQCVFDEAVSEATAKLHRLNPVQSNNWRHNGKAQVHRNHRAISQLFVGRVLYTSLQNNKQTT